MHECMRGGCVQRRRWLFNYGTPDLSGLRASLLACGPGLVTQTCWKDQSPGRMGWDDGGHGPPSCPPVSWLGLEGSTACSHRVQYAPCWPTNVNHPTSTSTVWLILPLSWLRPSVPAHLPTTRLTNPAPLRQFSARERLQASGTERTTPTTPLDSEPSTASRLQDTHSAVKTAVGAGLWREAEGDTDNERPLRPRSALAYCPGLSNARPNTFTSHSSSPYSAVSRAWGDAGR